MIHENTLYFMFYAYIIYLNQGGTTKINVIQIKHRMIRLYFFNDGTNRRNAKYALVGLWVTVFFSRAFRRQIWRTTGLSAAIQCDVKSRSERELYPGVVASLRLATLSLTTAILESTISIIARNVGQSI